MRCAGGGNAGNPCWDVVVRCGVCGVVQREDRCGVCGVVPWEDRCGVWGVDRCGMVCERPPLNEVLTPEGRMPVCWKPNQAACASS